MNIRPLLTYLTTLITAAATILILSGCDDGLETPPGPTPVVVEGWIEQGEAPVVIVTRSVDMTQDAVSFDNYVEKWCRVTIYDNGQPYILTGRIDKDYTPAFIFTSSRLKGAEGHTYRLLVETSTDTVEAVSTMPRSIPLESLKAERVEGSDSLYTVRAKMRGVAENEYYKLFSKSGAETRFYGAFLGAFTGYDYDPEGMTVTRGNHSGYEEENSDFSHYFKSRDIVTVKVCVMEQPLYDFWKVYDSNVSLSGNLFFTFASNCPHTVSGGLGYFAAYGMSRRSVKIP